LNANNKLAELFDYFQCHDTTEVILGCDEISSWPDGVFDQLFNNALLKTTLPANFINCSECEECCRKEISRIESINNLPARAFIICDQRDDVGRIIIDFEHFRQWKLDGNSLSQKLSKLLGFTKPPSKERGLNKWILGVLEGKKHKAQISLIIDNGVSLHISSHVVPLTEILSFEDNNLTIDKDEIYRLIDKPIDKENVYKPSTIRNEARKLKTQEQWKLWQKEYRKQKKDKPGMTDDFYSKQIAKSDVGNGRSIETIRKHMKQ